MTIKLLALCVAAVASGFATSTCAADDRELARSVLKELIEIDTTDSNGSVSLAADAIARRLRAAGVPDRDITVLGPNERKRNLVVRLPGAGHGRPVLFIGHLDVVEAPRVDWATDPFKLIEKDGYFYGRGTQDMKAGDAIAVATVIRLRREGFVPDRDVVFAFTAGEESFKDNGVRWLVEHRRELVDSEFVINMDGGGVLTEKGRPVAVRVDAAEKLYADFKLTIVNPGGTTALPVPDNAIYRLAQGLTRLARYHFPLEINPITRAYFERVASSETEPRRSDLYNLLSDHPSADAVERLSFDALDNALLRTNCVATRLEAGHANNALPQLATAMVNCRILPGHSTEEVRKTLVDVLDDRQIAVTYIREFDGQELDHGPDAVALPPSIPPPPVLMAVEYAAQTLWPGTPVSVGMATGESDAVWTSSVGMPTYALSGLAIERNDIRAHGKDERLGVESFYGGLDFFYRFVKTLTGPH